MRSQDSTVDPALLEGEARIGEPAEAGSPRGLARRLSIPADGGAVRARVLVCAAAVPDGEHAAGVAVVAGGRAGRDRGVQRDRARVHAQVRVVAGVRLAGAAAPGAAARV